MPWKLKFRYLLQRQITQKKIKNLTQENERIVRLSLSRSFVERSLVVLTLINYLKNRDMIECQDQLGTILKASSNYMLY